MKDFEITATLQAQTALLIALAHVCPQPDYVLEAFGQLISRGIERERDPRVAGTLQTLEEAYRQAIGQRSRKTG